MQYGAQIIKVKLDNFLFTDDDKCEQIIQQKISRDFQANFDSSPEDSGSHKAKIDFMNTKVKRRKKNKDAFWNNRSLTNRNNQNSYNLVSQNKEDVKEANDNAENSKRSYSFTSPNNSFRIEAIESDRVMNEMGNIELALETTKTIKIKHISH